MTSTPDNPPRARPISPGHRNTYLDLIRGVAVLVILLMNVVSFGLDYSAYWDLSAGGTRTWLDWLVGGLGEVFVDQKFMGLFSVLFGAGVALFIDRAEEKQRRPILLSLRRNAFLLVIGIVHTMVWDGDILIIYALSSVVVILLRNLRPVVLMFLGGATVMLSPVAAFLLQAGAGDGSVDFGYAFWESDTAITFLVADIFARSIGMMLIGVGLYRNGIVTGDYPDGFYRRTAVIGLGVGLPLAASGLALTAAHGFSAEVALVGAIPNTLGTIPATLGYMSLIILWNRRAGTSLHRRLQAAGRMALTNYLTQTLLGILILRWLLAEFDLTRTMLAGFVIAIWALQLWWSAAWLDRFRYGPMEWLLRTGTYLRPQPLRR